MEVRALDIPDVKLVIPKVIQDERGAFAELFNGPVLKGEGLAGSVVQINRSLSRHRGVVRGLHFQTAPQAQAKLVGVTRGAILDVAVDLRRSSETFGRHVAVRLDRESSHQLWIPEGLAHGFCTLEIDTEVIYAMTEVYAPASERAVRWNDPALAIDWPIGPEDAILSDRDRAAPLLSEIDAGELP